MTAKRRNRRFVPDVIRTFAGREPEAARGLGRRQPRHEGEDDRRRERQAHADPQQARVHGQVERTHRKAGRIARQDSHHRPGDGNAEDGTRAAEQQALGEERAPQRAGARAERRADRQLAFAPHRPREDQVRDVRARDDEHQGRRGEKHEQDGPRRRHNLIAQADGVDAEVGRGRVGLGMFLDDRTVDGPQLGARGLELDARRQAPEELRHPVHSPILHRRRKMVRARDDVGDDLGLRWVRHRRFENPHDGRRAVAEPYRLAEDRAVALERLAPEAVREHRRPGRRRAIVGRPEQAAVHGPQAHDLEVRAPDDARTHHARLAEANHRELNRGKVAERVERADARAQVLDLRHREDRVLDPPAGRALADIDEPIFIAIDQRPQENPADDAEDGGIGADAERQGDDHCDGQPLDPGERPESKANIGDEAHNHPITCFLRICSPRGPRPAIEPRPNRRLPISRIRTCEIDSPAVFLFYGPKSRIRPDERDGVRSCISTFLTC